jgi:PAS domain S-box-containing protein
MAEDSKWAKRILLVEDNPDHSLLIRTRLRRLDDSFQVQIVETGEDALELLEDKEVDLILSDYELPGMNGIEMLNHLRSKGKMQPCIFLTGQGSEQIAIEALRAGASDYFTKEEGLARYERLVNSINKAINKIFMERELTDYRHFLETIIDTIPDPIFIKDRNHRWVILNQSFCALVGHSKNEMLLRSDYDFFPSHEADFFWKKDEEMFETGEKVEIPEERITDSHGTQHSLTTLKVPLRDRDGIITHLVGIIRDITEKKAIDEALKKSEQQLRLIVENTMDVIYSARADGTITYISPQTINWGITPQEIIGRNILEFIHPDDIPRIVEDFEVTIKTGRQFTSYFRLRPPSGRIFNVEEYGRAIFEGGQVVQVTGVIRDISDRMRTQRMIIDTEETVKAFLGVISDPTALLDREGKLLSFNKEMADLLGKPEKELQGMTMYELSPMGSQGNGKALLDRAIRQGVPLRREDAFKEKWFDYSIYPIVDADGVVTRVVVHARDITKRKQIEQHARKFVSLVENSTEFIAMANLEGRVLYMNRAALELVGLDSFEEASSKHISDFVEEGRKLSLLSHIIPQVRQSGLWEGEGTVRHFKTGKSIEVSVITFLIKDDGAGEPLCFATIMRDITERKRAHEEMKKKNREMEGFIHAVSHDLRTPLMSIKEFSDMALRDDLVKASSEVRHALERIQVNSRRILDMIRGLQKYAQYSSRREHFERLSLGAIVREVVADLSANVDLKSVTITIQQEWPEIIGEHTAIYQVFMNLFSNAIKYGAKAIEAGWREDGDFYRIWIRDDGIGIEEEFMEKAFDVFARSPRVSSETEGAGIGLALVKKALERHGGVIWAESRLGEGSTFTMTLPAGSNGLPPEEPQKEVHDES